MNRREALRITAVAGLSTAFGGGITAAVLRDAKLRRVRDTRTHMGTVVTLTTIHPRAATAREMNEAAFAEMARLERILSRHDPSAAVGRLNARGSLADPPLELLEVLAFAALLSERSEGAFDVTMTPLLDLSRSAFASTGKPPTPESIRAARSLVNWRGVEFDAGSVRLVRPGMSITLDGIAKGFVVDRTLAALTDRGAERVLVDAGGDMATGGSRVEADPWTVGVQDPRRAERTVDLIRLGGECVATSGDYLQSFTSDRRHHHIVDPRTGRSPLHSSSVSVVARSAMAADALSTAIMVLGPRDGAALVERYAGASALIVSKSGEIVRTPAFSGPVTLEV